MAKSQHPRNFKIDKIHSDDRGQIFLLTGNLKEHEEITLFTTNKGFARGGCIHRLSDEYCTVFEGIIRYFIGYGEPVVLRKGQTIKIPKGTPHYFVSLEDSLVAEWGATPEEKKEKHPEFRKRMEECNDAIRD